MNMISSAVRRGLIHITIIVTGILGLTYVPEAQALPVDHYAASSRLSQGRWVRIRVAEAGMHFIADATLRNLGFTDPSKVRVYGTGGRMEPEALSASMADDLPAVACMRTAKGLVFYADDHFTWSVNNNTGTSGEDGASAGNTPYTHVINPYTHDAFYFLSDTDEDMTLPTLAMPATSGEKLTTFTERLVHEEELSHLGESGRNYVGEDFRTTRSQTFRFNLTGQAGGEAQVNVRFASKVTGGTATLAAKGNGAALGGASSVRIEGVSSEMYARFGDITGTTAAADKLEVNLEYEQQGALFLANLDYIEVFYPRTLQLTGSDLLIHGTFAAGVTLEVSGVDDNTQIWDITDRLHPQAVDCGRSGGKALIGIATGGYRELIVFNPEKVSRTVTGAGTVANQDLHSLPAPDMLIISTERYAAGAETIAAMHRSRDNMNVLILDPQLIYNEFSGGKRDVSAWRKLLKMWHDRGGAPRYCLIMGKPSYDNKLIDSRVRNAGYEPVPIWQSLEGLSEAASYSNDDYIGMLDDVEADAFSMSRATIHVAVGRLPVKDATEAGEVAEKIVRHVMSPTLGAWRNKVMLIADDSDNSSHFNQAQTCYEGYRTPPAGQRELYDRLYLDSYPLVNTATGPSYPQATARMLNNYNEGVAMTHYIGHASEVGWGHEHLWVWNDIIGMTNTNLTFMYAATCRFNPWDETGVSGGEHLMLNTKGGVAGMVVASRTVYISQNGELSRYWAREMFKTDDEGLPRRLGDAYVEAKNNYKNDANKLRYVFMGDPAMRLTGITGQVSVDHINGTELDGAGQLPEIEGGSRMTVAGTVLDADGNVDMSFNGTVTLQLYDAETVIETYGNGDNGKQEIYNDRKTRLALANTKVTAGRWSTMLTVPLEISNNYQPALLSAYAWTDSGKEANGFSESLYVYGFIDEEDIDSKGPEIEHFYLNRETFKNGDIVNPNPVAFIRLSDPSGINVSDAGVGHRISLRIDDDTPLSDVSQYYTPDVDGTGGTVVYGLKDLAPGQHTLTLEAWDNLNNSTRSTLNFGVSANADPYIVEIGTDCNPASSGVNFKIILDQPNTMMKCDLKIYDIGGRLLWQNNMQDSTGTTGTMSTYWDLCDSSGARVPRGIYLYRARVETPQGTWSTRTQKLAVTAQ